MGSIWHCDETGRWDVRPFTDGDLDAVRLREYGAGTEKGAALLPGPNTLVYVNGQRVTGGLRILQHKDEILVDGRRYFYSAEMRPEIVPFDGTKGSPKCAICRVAISKGDLVVRCPRCGRIYHQTEVKPCWTYREQCKFCQHPTSLSGQPGWSPELEEDDV